MITAIDTKLSLIIFVTILLNSWADAVVVTSNNDSNKKQNLRGTAATPRILARSAGQSCDFNPNGSRKCEQGLRCALDSSSPSGSGDQSFVCVARSAGEPCDPNPNGFAKCEDGLRCTLRSSSPYDYQGAVCVPIGGSTFFLGTDTHPTKAAAGEECQPGFKVCEDGSDCVPGDDDKFVCSPLATSERPAAAKPDLPPSDTTPVEVPEEPITRPPRILARTKSAGESCDPNPNGFSKCEEGLMCTLDITSSSLSGDQIFFCVSDRTPVEVPEEPVTRPGIEVPEEPVTRPTRPGP